MRNQEIFRWSKFNSNDWSITCEILQPLLNDKKPTGMLLRVLKTRTWEKRTPTNRQQSAAAFVFTGIVFFFFFFFFWKGINHEGITKRCSRGSGLSVKWQFVQFIVLFFPSLQAFWKEQTKSYIDNFSIKVPPCNYSMIPTNDLLCPDFIWWFCAKFYVCSHWFVEAISVI